MSSETQQADSAWWDHGEKSHSVPLSPAVPMDVNINTWSRFGQVFEAYEYTGWIDESLSWKTDCYIGDWSSLAKARVTGPDAKAFFEFISTNQWPDFKPGQAKHAIFCQENGKIVGDGLVLMLAENDFLFTSGPGTVWATYQLHYGRKKFDASLHLVTDDWCLLQVQGPKSIELMDEITDKGVRDIKFMHWKTLSIDGVEFMCLRQGVSGELGFEIWGPMKDAKKIFTSVFEQGKSTAFVDSAPAQSVSITYVVKLPPTPVITLLFLGTTEAAFATPAIDFIPAVHEPADSEELVKFRQYTRDINFDFERYLSSAYGSYGSDPRLYHFTPFDLGWGRLVNFDHEFIGRDALSGIKDSPPNKLVTLVWNKEDVIDVFASLFRPESFEYMEMPRNLLGAVNGSTVSIGGKVIGCAVSRCYSYWFKDTISLAIIKTEDAVIGTDVEVTWGSAGSPQKIIRAVVQPAPYKEDKRRHLI
ncbi:hypothetical protein NM208_g9107 [Fusarium decemcellulare]|uniref:Uncharacterized protein n=1 Tax=Fusarium decemcellulare TaxID=57161 RepID=A0ACC1S2V5_9HYPO|nr:hypothetical protein NM208_g9107 [Fusarium decemcellulare]